jgi:hypothetical protein
MKHPHHDLSFICSRRRFWLALLQEIFVIQGSFKGGQDCRLSELGSLPDHQLAHIKPVVHPDCEIFVDQGHVWSRCKKTEVTLKLFPIGQANLLAFNMFDGRHGLDEIGERLSQEMGWDQAAGFAHVRDLFLSLARSLVCVPGNPLDADE